MPDTENEKLKEYVVIRMINETFGIAATDMQDAERAVVNGEGELLSHSTTFNTRMREVVMAPTLVQGGYPAASSKRQ